MAIAGVLCLLAFVAYDAWMHTPVRFGFMRDFIVNHHWTPRGVTLFWVGAVLFVSTPAVWYLMDYRGWAPRWLVELGQTAMMLYFVHQIIVFTIVKGWLIKRWPDLAIESWPWSASLEVAGLLGRQPRPDGGSPLHRQGLAVDEASAPPPAGAGGRAGALDGVIPVGRSRPAKALTRAAGFH